MKKDDTSSTPLYYNTPYFTNLSLFMEKIANFQLFNVFDT